MRLALLVFVGFLLICSVKAQDTSDQSIDGAWEVITLLDGRLVTLSADGINASLDLPEAMPGQGYYALSADRRWLAAQAQNGVVVYDLHHRACCITASVPLPITMGFQPNNVQLVGFLPDEPNTLLLNALTTDELYYLYNQIVAFDVERQVYVLGAERIMGWVEPGSFRITEQGVEVDRLMDIEIDAYHPTPPSDASTYDPFSGERVDGRGIIVEGYSGGDVGDYLTLTDEYIAGFAYFEEDTQAGTITVTASTVMYRKANQPSQSIYLAPTMDGLRSHWVLDGNAVLIVQRDDWRILLRDGRVLDVPQALNQVFVAGTPDGWLMRHNENSETVIEHFTVEAGEIVSRELVRLRGTVYRLPILYATPLGATASGTFPQGEMPAG